MSFFDTLGQGVGSFFDDVTNLGSKALEVAGENADVIWGNGRRGVNPQVYPQPQPSVVDNKGNAVTVPQGGSATLPPKDNTLLYAGIGGAAFVLLLIVILATKGK